MMNFNRNFYWNFPEMYVKCTILKIKMDLQKILVIFVQHHFVQTNVGSNDTSKDASLRLLLPSRQCLDSTYLLHGRRSEDSWLCETRAIRSHWKGFRQIHCIF